MSLSYSNNKPLAIDLYAGLGGWSEGFLPEGYRCVGFDIERHQYGDQRYPGQLVLQDILTVHGSQFKDAAVIVASPPCQQYSWLAMPWSRSKDPNNSKAAKALRAKWEAEGPDNRLFDACFRIQREAIEATRCELCDGVGRRCVHESQLTEIWDMCSKCKGTGGRRHIPLIVENVRGAQEWVGRSAWNFGSFHLWGDVPALMPIGMPRKRSGRNFHTYALTGGAVSSPSYHGGDHETLGVGMGIKTPGRNLSKGSGKKFGTHNMGSADEIFAELEGTKIGGDWFSDPNSTCRKHGSKSNARKATSATIAKIPFALSQHIAQVYKPRTVAVA